MNKENIDIIDSIIIGNKVYQYASKKDRFISGFIDRFICFIIALTLTAIPTIIAINIINNNEDLLIKIIIHITLILIVLIFLSIIHFIIYCFYFGFFEKKGKQTIGKKIRKIKSYDKETHKVAYLTHKHTLLRYGLDMILLYYFLPDKNNQYKHDKESNIVVLKER